MLPIYPPRLPPEMLVNVFKYLSPDDIGRAGRVCREWYQTAKDDMLWKRWNPDKTHKSLCWKEFIVDQIIRERFVGVYPVNNQLYLVNGAKFKVFPPRPPMVPGVYDYHPNQKLTRMTCICPYTSFTKEEIALRGIKIFTGSEDHLIRLWSIKEIQERHFDLKCVATLMGHHGRILHIRMRNDHIFSAAADQTIKVWKIVRNQNLRIVDIKTISTAKMPKGRIAALIPLSTDFHKYSFYVAIDNRIEKYWVDDKENVSRDVIHVSHKDKITSLCQLALKLNILFSGTSLGDILVWETEFSGKQSCTQIIRAHEDAITYLVSHSFKRQLISGSMRGEICVWEKKKENEPWSLLQRFQEQHTEITQIRFGPHLGNIRQQSFFSLSKDNTIVYWEFVPEKNKYELIIKLTSPLTFFSDSLYPNTLSLDKETPSKAE